MHGLFASNVGTIIPVDRGSVTNAIHNSLRYARSVEVQILQTQNSAINAVQKSFHSLVHINLTF